MKLTLVMGAVLFCQDIKDALTENKKRKHQLAVEKQQSKSKTERKWKENEEIGSSLRGLKTGKLVLTDKFQIVIHI